MKSTTAWTALWLGLSASAWASECRLQVSGLRYPPLAAQARIQGVVQVNAVLLGGRLASKPSATGHPLLAAVAEQAVERAEWTDCEEGEPSLRFEFQLVDPCSPRIFAIEQTGSANFRIAMSQPNPCVFTMSEHVVRRFLFWKRKVVRCEESCPPCHQPVADQPSASLR